MFFNKNKYVKNLLVTKYYSTFAPIKHKQIKYMAKKKNSTQEEMPNPRKIYSPKDVYDMLNEYVIGQDEAKKTLSVAICNHQRRILWNVYKAFPGKYKIVNKKTGVEITEEQLANMPKLSLMDYKIEGDEEFQENMNITLDKSNILLLGKTGTGKTYMLKQIAKHLNIPCYIADTTKLTQAGYVGDDVENIIVGLLREADMDVNRAQEGIIILDEIDKIGRKGDNPSITRDVSGEGVQQGLLKIVEGGIIGVPPNGGRKHPEQELLYVDTSNILFIGMGSFEGIEKIIERRLNTRTCGFNQGTSENVEEENILSNVMQEDIKSFGIIPELLGRFPVVTYTNDLTKEDLIRIIKEPKNCIIKQYQKLFQMDNNDIHFTDGAIESIAEMSLSLKIGARGLRGIIEKILNNLCFEMSGKRGENITIDRKYVDSILKRKKVA